MYGIGVAPEIAYDTAQPLSQAIQVGGSLLNAPESIAIDGNGNVFIADPGLNEILRVPATDLTCATPTDCTVVSYHTNLVNPGTGPFGIAIDGAGNVYTSIYSLDDVLQITPSDAESYILGNLSTVLYAPSGLAVGGDGDVSRPQ
jgi:large repetitive protein